MNNDPPPGTRVMFLREIRKARRYDVGTLIAPMRKYLTERADDEFIVRFEGEETIVHRQDIEQI